MLGSLYPPLIALGVGGAVLARRRQEHRRPVELPTGLAVAATGVALAIATNLHGAALVLGILLGLLWRQKSSERS